MALISLRQLLDHAAEHGYGVPAFNVNNLEQVLAIMQAADESESPVILQASAGARKYAGEAFLRKMLEAAGQHIPHSQPILEINPTLCFAIIDRLLGGLGRPGDEIREFLKDKLDKIAWPDAVEFVDELPLGATGKILKTELRKRFKGYSLPG